MGPCQRGFAATLLLLVGGARLHGACASAMRAAFSPTQVSLVSIHPHNTTAFTEGFFFMDGTVVESTGLERHSFIRQYRLSNPSDVEAVVSIHTNEGDDDADSAAADEDEGDGTTMVLTHRPAKQPSSAILNQYTFDAEIFGEGIAAIGDKLYALTYKHNKVLVLSKADFSLVGTHPFHTSTGEGWGMTTDGELLIVSDGSSSIQFFDPQQNFKRVRSIDVTSPATGEKIDQINELEFVEGEILANVWFKNVILRIDPIDGRVIEELDLSWVPAMVPNLQTMNDQRMRNEAVMNGIAYNRKNGHIYITGKLWDSIFELELSYLKRHARRHYKSDV